MSILDWIPGPHIENIEARSPRKFYGRQGSNYKKYHIFLDGHGICSMSRNISPAETRSDRPPNICSRCLQREFIRSIGVTCPNCGSEYVGSQSKNYHCDDCHHTWVKGRDVDEVKRRHGFFRGKRKDKPIVFDHEFDVDLEWLM
jgi:hypothetical protein